MSNFKVSDGNYSYLVENNMVFSINFDGTKAYKVSSITKEQREMLTTGKTVVLNHEYEEWQKGWSPGIQYSVKKIN